MKNELPSRPRASIIATIVQIVSTEIFLVWHRRRQSSKGASDAHQKKTPATQNRLIPQREILSRVAALAGSFERHLGVEQYCRVGLDNSGEITPAFRISRRTKFYSRYETSEYFKIRRLFAVKLEGFDALYQELQVT